MNSLLTRITEMKVRKTRESKQIFVYNHDFSRKNYGKFKNKFLKMRQTKFSRKEKARKLTE